MPTYEFEVQEYERVKVEAANAEEARMKLVDSRKYSPSAYISDGIEVEG